MRERIILTAKDNVPIRLTKWAIDDPKAAVLILHGMAEHSYRYERFALELNKAGYTVFGLDFRGHGEGWDRLGFLAEEDGELKVLSDIFDSAAYVREQVPAKPLYLFAHSMGTMFARFSLMRQDALKVDKVILSGIPVMAKRPAPPKDAPKSNKPFGSLNAAFAPNRTDADWLSRDEDEVDKYVADPLCGFATTPEMGRDVAKASMYIAQSGIEKLLPDVPYGIFVGSVDPCGGEAGAEYVKELWSAAGKNVRTWVYEGARHEVLNETNRDEVTRDMIAFLDE